MTAEFFIKLFLHISQPLALMVLRQKGESRKYNVQSLKSKSRNSNLQVSLFLESTGNIIKTLPKSKQNLPKNRKRLAASLLDALLSYARHIKKRNCAGLVMPQTDPQPGRKTSGYVWE